MVQQQLARRLESLEISSAAQYAELVAQRQQISQLQLQLANLQSLASCSAGPSFPALVDGSVFAYTGCARDVARFANVSSERCQKGLVRAVFGRPRVIQWC